MRGRGESLQQQLEATWLQQFYSTELLDQPIVLVQSFSKDTPIKIITINCKKKTSAEPS